MSIIRVQAVLQQQSGLREDDVVNVWHFGKTGDAVLADYQAAAAAVQGFYVDISSRFGNNIWGGADAHITKVYEVDEGAPGPEDDFSGSPKYTDLFTITPTGGGAAPTQMCAVLSFNAVTTDIREEVGNTRPAARRRGRLYVGPLAQSAFANNVANQPMISAATQDLLLDAAQTLHTAALAANIPWCVYSRMDGLARAIVRAHVDNSPDVIRRRKTSASNRDVRNLPIPA